MKATQAELERVQKLRTNAETKLNEAQAAEQTAREGLDAVLATQNDNAYHPAGAYPTRLRKAKKALTLAKAAREKQDVVLKQLDRRLVNLRANLANAKPEPAPAAQPEPAEAAPAQEAGE